MGWTGGFELVGADGEQILAVFPLFGGGVADFERYLPATLTERIPGGGVFWGGPFGDVEAAVAVEALFGIAGGDGG